MKYIVVQAFWYFDQVTGEFNYRIKGPGRALAADPRFQVVDIHVFHPLFPQLALSADLLILHLLPDAEIGRIIQLRRAAGRKTIFEIADNFLEPGPWVGPDDALRNPVVRGQVLQHAAWADACQYSTEPVAEVFAGVNPVGRVFENLALHFCDDARAETPFTFGWGGSVGHRDDLAGVAAAVIGFCRDHDDVQFLYMGHPPIYDALFGELGAKGARIDAGPIEAYYAFLSRLHVGIAPLQDTAFNRCRSDVKFLEYAAHRVAPVLADAAPYRRHAVHGETALIFENPAALRAHLERLYAQRDTRDQLAAAAFAYARNARDGLQTATTRAAWYASLIGGAPATPEWPELPDCTGLIAYMRQATHALDQGRPHDAATILEKVLRIHPGYHLAQMVHARTLVALGEHTRALTAYLPADKHPVYADLYYECLAVAAREAGHDAWVDLAAHIEDPALRVRIDPRVSLLDKARTVLAHQPFDFAALQVLAQAGVAAPDALARLRFLHPEQASS